SVTPGRSHADRRWCVCTTFLAAARAASASRPVTLAMGMVPRVGTRGSGSDRDAPEYPAGAPRVSWRARFVYSAGVKVLFLSNTRSGRGLSRWAARVFPSGLRDAGHEVVEAAVGEPHVRLLELLKSSQALILAGGDGTVHRTAIDAIAAGVPIYQVPCG